MGKAAATGDILRLDQVKVSQYFGCNTFGDRAMKERLPKDIHKAFKEALRKGLRLSPEVAHGVAQAMKDGRWSAAPPTSPTGSCP